MKISTYKKMIKKNLRSRTVTFLLKGNKVMLGLKNKGFGKGYYLGIGGKVESDETIEQAAKREIEEEVEVKVKTVNNQGILNFYFPHIENESWNQQVHVFIVTKWEGEPKETEEISPEWFDKKEIPLDLMWDDARYWLPEILTGKKVKAVKVVDENIKFS